MARVLLFLLIAVLLVALGALAWFYSIARSALPQLDGSLKIPGLSAKVTVIRDGHGVPTIGAANLDDLFLAQGYVTAQDRLWQMDMMRRFAAGEVSEILGDAFLKHDREQRILGLKVAAQKALEVAPAQNRSHFAAYARGVNAYIESHRDRLPIEFRILRYSPRQWAPEDSTLIASQMVKDLNHYPYRDALEREKILARLGPEQTADLYVNSSWRDRPPTVARPGLDQDTDEENRPRRPIGSSVAGTSSSADFRNLVSASRSDAERLVIGSNNWVVSGAHTVSANENWVTAPPPAAAQMLQFTDFTIDSEDGPHTAAFERVVHMPRHIPDGIAFDETGRLWIACHRPDILGGRMSVRECDFVAPLQRARFTPRRLARKESHQVE
jgi:penicillin amidase